MSCFSLRPAKGTLLIVTGTNIDTVGAELKRQHPNVHRVSDGMMYMPGENTPFGGDKIQRLLEVSKKLSQSGEAVLFELNDSARLPQLAMSLEDIPWRHAVVHEDIESIVDQHEELFTAAKALVDFGMEFKGQNKKTAKTVGYLSRVKLNRAIDQLRGDAVSDEIATLMQNYLLPVLGMTVGDAGVHLEPRNENSVGVDGANLKPAIKKLVQLLFSQPPQIQGSSFVDRTHFTCPTCNEFGGRHVPCPDCLENLQYRLTEQPTLGLSNFAELPVPTGEQKHYLVSGGCGFIGSHLVERLIAHGHLVTVVDNLSTGHRTNIVAEHPRLEVLIQDIKEYDFKHQIPYDGIFHLAATPAVQASWEDPTTVHNNNLTATVHVIKMARDRKIRRIVFASSAACYGNAKPPLDESKAQDPISPYGLQKFISEKYGRLFASNGGPDFVACRFFNVYGPRQDPHSPYSGVISVFVDHIRDNQPITIFGDGGQTRDFVFVKDIVKGLHKSMNHQLGAKHFEVMNLATGNHVTLKTLAKEVAGTMPGHMLKLNFTKARVGDIRHSFANVDHTSANLGWHPTTPLHEGLKALVEWSIAEKKKQDAKTIAMRKHEE